MERVFRKENLADKRAGKKGISALKGVQDETRAEEFGTGGLFLADGND